MTRVQVTYVAVNEDGVPFATASDSEELKKGIDYYFGVNMGSAECLGFEPYESKYGDEFEGRYTYKYKFLEEWLKEEIKVYCVDYYPNTIYEVNDSRSI